MNNDITVNRKIRQWEWYKNSNTKDVFLELLLTANWHDGKFMGQPILRGQCVFGLLQLSTNLGISVRSVRTALTHLKSTGEVTIKATNKYSIATIVKYSEYQISSYLNDNQNDKQSDNPPTNERQTTDNIQISKSSKSVNQSTTPIAPKGANDTQKPVKRFIPPTIEEITTYCAERGKGVDPEKWLNHYQANGWMVGKTKMKNWEAAVRTWEPKDKSKSNMPDYSKSKDFFGD